MSTTTRTAPAIGSRVTFQGRTAYVCEVGGDRMRIAETRGSEYGPWVPTPPAQMRLGEEG